MLATAFRGVERSEGGGSVKVVGEGNFDRNTTWNYISWNAFSLLVLCACF